jgi:hypothetical protein
VAEAADEIYRRTKPFSTVMKISNTVFIVKAFECLLLGFALGLPIAASADENEMGKAFASPEEAVSALTLAANSQNGSQLREIFGPASTDLQNPDRVQATNEMEWFASALSTTNRIVQESPTNCELEVGADMWPFPVPIVKVNGHWFWDTAAGENEILNRRIGRNELDVLSSMRAYVDAQREYASKDHTGDEVLEYAQRIASSPGKKDGLYWSSDIDGEESPLGPFVADAQQEGYKVHSNGQSTTRAPFHGYYFKILTAQGSHAPGGKYNYIINGHMIAGFALVAWPADYGNSGIMTFIVNQQGRVYQKDLGTQTSDLAPAMTEYDPGPGWSQSHE